MASKIKCPMCGSPEGHTRQCSLNIKVDPKESQEREARRKQLDEAKAKMPKTNLPEKK